MGFEPTTLGSGSEALGGEIPNLTESFQIYEQLTGGRISAGINGRHLRKWVGVVTAIPHVRKERGYRTNDTERTADSFRS